jgi:hypothetical protein
MKQPILGFIVVCFYAVMAFGQSSSPAPAPNQSGQAPPEQVKLSPEFEEAGTAASDAISRIPDSRSPDDGYQARKLDAEKAVDIATHKANTDADKEVLKLLIAWRRLAVMQYEFDPKGDPKAFQRVEDAAMDCRIESKAVFSPKSLSEKGRQKAAEKKCLPEYRKIRDAGQ